MARLLALATALLSFALATVAEPAQYCRFGYRDGQADFCMAVSTYENVSTSARDVYLSMTVTRASAVGWTAVGTGAEMAGSLMFIVYGDPVAGTDPIVSIRTIDGHHQPQLLSTKPLRPGAVAPRILHARWRKLSPSPSSPSSPQPRRRHDDSHDKPIIPSGPATHVADVAVACYGCGDTAVLAAGQSRLSAEARSQPWIWAWNDRQVFDAYLPDARLDMHHHHVGRGGYGAFYVDMVAAAAADASALPPQIRPEAGKVGASDTPLGLSGFIQSLGERPLPKMHGSLMGAAFLALFPAGVVLMRTAGGNPFRRHWTVQLAATALAWLGAVVAAVMTGGQAPRTAHQWIGVVVVLALAVQAVLGWRHHMVFLRIRKRTWISHAHIWLGRTAVVAGWVNVLTGLSLSGHGGFVTAMTASAVAIEAAGVGLWVWLAQRRRAAAATARQPAKGTSVNAEAEAEAHALIPTAQTGDDYFSIETSDDEDDIESGADDVEEKPDRMRRNKRVDAER